MPKPQYQNTHQFSKFTWSKCHRFALRYLLLVSLLTSLVATACSTREIRRPAPPEMPLWCKYTSGVMEDEQRGKLAIGVGAISDIKAHEMALANSDSKARTQIAKLFNIYAEKLVEMYIEDLKTRGNAIDDDEISAITRALNLMNARGAAIEDRYIEKKTRTYFAKAVLPFSKFAEMIKQNDDLPNTVKEFAQAKQTELFAAMPKHEPSGEYTAPKEPTEDEASLGEGELKEDKAQKPANPE